jgi:hypothetical protein
MFILIPVIRGDIYESTKNRLDVLLSFVLPNLALSISNRRPIYFLNKCCILSLRSLTTIIFSSVLACHFLIRSWYAK